MTPARRFVGRQPERRALTSALQRAAAGEPQVVVVTGDAGIGKTRLVDEVIGQARQDWLVAVGHCVEAGTTGLPYAPLFGVLGAIAETPQGKPLLDQAAQAAPGLLPLLGGEAGGPLVDTTSGLAQLRLFDSLMRLLSSLAQTRPILIVIEDLHWADQSTTAFLPFLCRNLARQPIAAVLTARTDELHRTHPLRLMLGELARLPSVALLELGPLTDADLADLLTDQLGTAAPRRVVRAIAGRSGGNPFFAEQLLEAGEYGAVSAADQHGAAGPLPVELADVLLHRVDRLGEDARHLLRAASLAGQRIEHDLLLAVTGSDEQSMAAALRECADARLFEPDPGVPGIDAYSFRHALLAEVIAADIVPPERRTLHARYVDAIAGEAPAAVVARHCLGARDLPGAFAWSVDAAQEASAVTAPHDALAHWERVIQLWPHGTYGDQARAGSLHEVALAASTAAAHAGELPRAAELARLALDEAATPGERALARIALAPLLTPLVTGREDEEIAVAKAAVDDAAGEGELAARARFTLARAYLHAGRSREAAAVADEAVAAARGQSSRNSGGDDGVLLGARATAYLARCRLGDVDAAEEAALGDAGQSSADAETGLWVLTRMADWWWPVEPARGEGLANAAYAYAVAQGVRTSVRGIWARETLTLCRWLTGAWDEIEQLAQADPLAVNDATAGTVALECEVDIARGRTDRARRVLEIADKVTTDALSKTLVAFVTVDLHLAEGDPAAAASRCLDALDDPPPETGFADFEGVLAARAVAAVADAEQTGVPLGHAAAVLAAADRVEERAARDPDPRLAAIPLSAIRAHRSRLGGHGDPELWRAAIELRAGQPFEIARCRYNLAAALYERGDAEGAHAQLAAAAETCRELGAVRLLERINTLGG